MEDAQCQELVRGGTEEFCVVANDGSAPQDIKLLMEMLEVVDLSLPLIGRANAAKLVFAPDHHSIVLIRRTDQAPPPPRTARATRCRPGT